MTPEEFPKLFAAAFASQDGSALLQMLADDAEVVTLTGALAEDQTEAKQIFEQEFAGTFAKVRLVWAQSAEGQELPRFGAVLTAVLLARAEGWRAVSLTFSAQS